MVPVGATVETFSMILGHKFQVRVGDKILIDLGLIFD
jgi:hypothetical protein